MRYMLGFVAAVSIASAGCAYLGAPVPETFREKVAAAQATVTGARELATTLLQAGEIDAGKAQEVQDQADTARAAIDKARELEGIDLSQAEARLESVRTILDALQAFITENADEQPAAGPPGS